MGTLDFFNGKSTVLCIVCFDKLAKLVTACIAVPYQQFVPKFVWQFQVCNPRPFEIQMVISGRYCNVEPRGTASISDRSVFMMMILPLCAAGSCGKLVRQAESILNKSALILNLKIFRGNVIRF